MPSSILAPSKPLYTSKILKASALISDTKTLFLAWDETLSVPENLKNFGTENIFGKASRARVRDILAIFRQRYLGSPDAVCALSHLVKIGFDSQSLHRIFYFYSFQNDALLRDIVTETLGELREHEQSEVSSRDFERAIQEWIKQGKTQSEWGSETLIRIVRNLAATLRDFEVLEGAAKKRLAPFFLPVGAFAFLAFVLHQRQPSGEKLLKDPAWRAFFLCEAEVESLFIEAHQHRLLEYHAAGSVIRLSFPSQTLTQYAYVISQRAS